MSCWSTSFEWPAGLDDRRPAPKALRPPGSEWLTNLVMNVHAAGLLIGRGGKRIKMLQEDSGVQIQVHELDSSQRLLELRGPPVELQDGLELLITELARIPEALAPKGTQILVPEYLAQSCAAEALKYGASDAAVVAGPCEGEQLLVIEGSVPARTTAAAAVTALVARHLYRVGQVAPHRLQVVASAKTPLVATNTRAANLIPWNLDCQGDRRLAKGSGCEEIGGAEPDPEPCEARMTSDATQDAASLSKWPMRVLLPKHAAEHLARGVLPQLASRFGLYIEMDSAADTHFAEISIHGDRPAAVGMSLLQLQPGDWTEGHTIREPGPMVFIRSHDRYERGDREN